METSEDTVETRGDTMKTDTVCRDTLAKVSPSHPQTDVDTTTKNHTDDSFCPSSQNGVSNLVQMSTRGKADNAKSVDENEEKIDDIPREDEAMKSDNIEGIEDSIGEENGVAGRQVVDDDGTGRRRSGDGTLVLHSTDSSAGGGRGLSVDGDENKPGVDVEHCGPSQSEPAGKEGQETSTVETKTDDDERSRMDGENEDVGDGKNKEKEESGQTVSCNRSDDVTDVGEEVSCPHKQRSGRSTGSLDFSADDVAEKGKEDDVLLSSNTDEKDDENKRKSPVSGHGLTESDGKLGGDKDSSSQDDHLSEQSSRNGQEMVKYSAVAASQKSDEKFDNENKMTSSGQSDDKCDVKEDDKDTKKDTNVKDDNTATSSAVKEDKMEDKEKKVSQVKAADSEASTSGASSEKPVKYKCPKCSRVMKDKRLIENHSCDNDGDEEKVKITIRADKEKQTFVCTECDFTNSGQGFEEHLMCHLMVRPYQCLYCKECFINRKEISRHVIKSHNGAKMSCALRALRKAKALIKDVTANGVTSFMAKVAGKVPLEKDPEKKRKQENASSTSTQSAVSSEKAEKPGQSLTEDKPPPQPNKEVGGETVVASKQPNPPGFSKLREVLTSGCPAPPPAASSDSHMSEDTGKSSNESGLKIVASYSLQDKEEVDSGSEKPSAGTEQTMEPNFIMTPPRDPDTQSEVLSFLGPERPIFKTSEGSTGPMLPPPPLQPAPSHSSTTSGHPPPPSQSTAAAKPAGKNPNFFICGFNCLFSSLSTSEFREHTTNFHSTETFYPCYYCGHRSPNENDLVRHISNHTHTHNKSSPLYVCGNDGCRFGTNMVTDYINHIKTSHPDIPQPLCYSCGDIFADISLLQTHAEENVIHIVNCPHCSSKATDRRAILNHISSAHPGKPKMVSVAKQLICHDRKLNNYEQMKQLREMLPPTLTPAPVSVIDQILSRQSGGVDSVRSSGSTLSDILTSKSTTGSRDTPSPGSRLVSPSSRRKVTTPDSGRSPTSESSDFGSVKVKEEMDEDMDTTRESGEAEDTTTSYTVDENGVRRRVYVPMSERQAENYRCKHCTFIARDLKRLHCHERSHGMPPTRKERFKCMFCPQGFDSEMKFRLHITCHPGLIKFLLYRCKKCEFDTNQKHTIVRHITCNRDRKHRGFGPVEDQYTVVSRSLESRVLECERCDYMTRHKIHMAIHYLREHNILRDKGEFSIEGLTPTDTPLSSYDLSPQNSGSSPTFQVNLQSPDECSSSLDGLFDFTKPTGSAKKSRDRSGNDVPHMTVTQISERNELFNKMVSQQAALQPGHVLENQMRKFKCPICKYLLPKAADLKNHVKRHSEIGQITLVMFRCKYCSCMSTARELLYEHLNEKHPGKPIALVKKIVAIDTTEVDKSFAETSMEESLDQLEESLHKEIMTTLNSSSPSQQSQAKSPAYEQLFVIPEGGEIFGAPLQCPKCSFSSHTKSEIVHHVTTLHTQVKVIGSDEDVEKLAKATTEDIQQAAALAEDKKSKLFQPGQEEVLIVPDDQVFKEPALCSRCDFTTMLRREMVLHLQQKHPDISVMGRNSYPVQVSAMGQKVGGMDESCVVGSGSLDAKIKCLYENYGTQMKCLICGVERPKKFFIHVHILRHLNIYLWKCAFCAHRGLQKYKMVDHIKKIHPGRSMSVRYLRVNVEAKVAQFLAQFNIIKNRKASLDGGLEVRDSLLADEMLDQVSNDSSRSRQRSPGPGGSSTHTLGSEELDEKLACLYDFSDGVFYKCIACPNQFQRKFAIHRHLIISHLKVALLSCGYCSMEGVEKHQLVDHIIACHKPAPVSIHNLHVDLRQKVSDFLAKLASGEHSGESTPAEISEIMHGLASSSNTSESDYAQDYFNRMFRPYAVNKKKKLGQSKLSKVKPVQFRFGNKTTPVSAPKKTNTVDPDVIMLGRDALDKELSCLYQARPTGQLRCLVCRWEFPRKYPLHRHIMLKHLKMNLVGCPYCPFQGVEKYNVSTHIKEEHKDQPINIKYTQPDVGSRVRQFVNDMASRGSGGQDLIRKPDSRDDSPLRLPKVENTGDADDDDDNDDDDKRRNNSNSTPHGGLVVAMFGKKKKSETVSSDDIVVKTEIEDEEYEEGTALHTGEDNDEEESQENSNFHDEIEDDYNEDDDPGADKSNYTPQSDSPSPRPAPKRPIIMQSYLPGSYRSPAGGKPKALDVITKIKVLKSKEGPITKFYCEQCKFTSLHRSNIVRHIYKIHEKYQTHTCPVCNYQTLSLMLMQKHMEKEHPGVEYQEDAFTLNPPRSKPRRRPLIGPLSFQKRRQDMLSKRLEEKSPHMASSSNDGPKQYACAYCHYETNTQEDILQHTRDNHSQGDGNSSHMKSPSTHENAQDNFSACWDGSKKAVKRRLQEDGESVAAKRKRRFIFEKGDELVQCGHCDTRETSMGRMEDHLMWDHPGQSFQAKRIPAWRFVCKSCPVKTMATSKMKYHLNRHVNYRPYTCTNCGAFFPSPDQCRRHSRAQGHEEQYTYVRNQKKEQRVEELLEGTRQLAIKVQNEAAKDPDFDMSKTDSFIAKFQDLRSNLKRSAPTGSLKNVKRVREAGDEEDPGDTDVMGVKKQYGKSAQTLGVEQDITIKCYLCEFKASNVSDVRTHHRGAHPGEKFLWTELERGFTCDATGEALPDSEGVPSSSLDVGYTTRMTLGSGSNTMRFKCKSCDFSSSVIQAMKSHLKSHQPKGFICPYCSRSFSGKEKLMRHQYCLHKGQPLWVIHLRRSGVVGSTTVKKSKGGAAVDSSSSCNKTENIVSQLETVEKESVAVSFKAKRSHQTPVKYLCSECSYTTESLYHYRLHCAQQHEEFTYKTQDTSVDSPLKCGYCAFLAETEAEFSAHIETHFSARSFQCGYCDYSAYDRVSVQRHLASNHASLEPKLLDLGAISRMGQEYVKGQNRKDLPLLLNLKPELVVEKISESVLDQYGCFKSDEEDGEEEEDDSQMEVENSSQDKTYDDVSSQADDGDDANDNNDNNEEDEERLVVVEGVSEMDMIDNEEDDDDEDDNHSDVAEEDGEGNTCTTMENIDLELQPAAVTTDSVELARQLGLVEDETSCVLGSETDMMIMQFGRVVSQDQHQTLTSDPADNTPSQVDINGPSTQNSPPVIKSKDSTLFAAQEKDEDGIDNNIEDEDDDDDDDDDEVNFDNDITLASPLPMISLGDGVSMSPVTMDNDGNENDNEYDDKVDESEHETRRESQTASGMLFDA